MFYLPLANLFHLIERINLFHIDWFRSDVVHTVKLVKTKKLFAFPKKSKHLSSNSTKSTNPPFNVSHFLTAVSLAQIQQMISFLMIDHSNFCLFSLFSAPGQQFTNNFFFWLNRHHSRGHISPDRLGGPTK